MSKEKSKLKKKICITVSFIKTLKLGQNKQWFLVIHTENKNIKKGRE